MSKNNLLISASAMALLAAMATASVSQSPGGGSAGGAQEEQKMSPGGGESNRDAGTQERGITEQPKGKGGSAQRDAEPRPKASNRAEEKASPKSRVQGQEATPKASERAQEKASPKSAVQGQQKKDGVDDRGARSAREKSKDTTKQSDQRQESGQRQGTGRDRAAGDAAKDQRGERVDRDRQADDRAKGNQGDGASERVQLTEQKRTSIRERMQKSAQTNRVTNINFDIRVGASVPRTTTLHVLPPDVVEIVPEYRGYRYVYVRDEIVIIHPTNYVVVAVIGGDSRVGARSGSRITLASDDRVFIRRHVDLGARIRLGIGGISIGMELPDTVELRPLPDVVIQRYPDLRSHRYFIYEDDVVIVEPQSREVVFVIEG
jgi:hypothetical protein